MILCYILYILMALNFASERICETEGKCGKITIKIYASLQDRCLPVGGGEQRKSEAFDYEFVSTGFSLFEPLEISSELFLIKYLRFEREE